MTCRYEGRHYCQNCRPEPDPHCRSPHPTREDVHCMRLTEHRGKHNAYTFSIRTPEEWS